MMPDIKLLDDIKGNDALLLQSCFPKGVIGLKSIKGILILTTNFLCFLLKLFYWLFSGVLFAYIEDCRKDNSSRNVFRYKQFDNKILLSKIQDHFICKWISLITIIIVVLYLKDL